MTSSVARAVARRVLAEVRTRDAWASALLSTALDDPSLEARDAALVTRLVYGVIAAEGTLDEALNRHLKRPGRVHPAVRDVLRIAAFELLFARTPHRAVVHEGVNATRALQPSAAGMANAVLRRLAEESDGFPWGDPASDLDALARLTAHPRWLVDLLVADIGDTRAREMLAAGLHPAPLYLAHNPFRGEHTDLIASLTRDGAQPCPEEPAGCVLAKMPRAALRSDALATGVCIVADASSQMVAALAAPPCAGRGVDVAAGRGTKTLLMQAEVLRRGGQASIIASDLHAFKVDVTRTRMADLGVPGVTGVVADLTDDHAVDVLGGPGSADAVLVDAPCSNLGTLRRHPERRWRMEPDDIEASATLASRMLTVASRLVRPGGFVVYSTCTVTRRENGDVVEAFLNAAAGQDFAVESVRDDVPDTWSGWVTTEGCLQVYPAVGGPDGHFAARMRRVGGA